MADTDTKPKMNELDDGQVEFTFPDETPVETKSETEPVKVEVVDDTPPADRGRVALESDDDIEPTEEELKSYSEKVQQRINKLTHAKHDERRRREALERERDEAIRAAQSLLAQNESFKKRAETGEQFSLSQATQLAEVQFNQAKSELKIAHETGDTDLIVSAQTKLNDAQAALNTVKRVKLPQTQTSDTVPTNQAAQPTTPTPNAKAMEWKKRNSWFEQDAEMTGLALAVHGNLVRANYDVNSDDYFKAIDTRMRQVFPDKFKDTQTVTTQDSKPAAVAAAKTPATVVAPVSRATTPKKVVLSATAVSIARRLGVPLDVYAKQVAALESKNG